METKLKIIDELDKSCKGIHLRGLSRVVKTGLPNVRRFLVNLEDENVVKVEKSANLSIFKLKESEKTMAYLKQVHTERFLDLPGRIRLAISDFLKDIEISPLIALIFGSYASGNYTEESDIDLLLVFQKVDGRAEFERVAGRIGMRTNTKLSPIYISYPNFKKNFLDKNHDFSKEIRQNAIIINGIENYYSLLWRFLE